MNPQSYLQLMQLYNNSVNSLIIKTLIKDNAATRDRMIEDYNNYKGEKLPIQTRTFDDANKINRKLNNDFRGEIVDQGVGFLFGKPITYLVEKSSYIGNLTGYETDLKYFQDFLKINQVDDLDMETGKRQGICGAGKRLLYIDKNGKERMMNLNPWEVVLIYDASIDEVQYAMRYYDVEIVASDGSKTTRARVEWYDKKYITYYIENEQHNFVPDETQSPNPQEHLFDGVPIIDFVNNDEQMSDFTKVEELIDSYDRALSDAQNEIEEFRQAYMIFEGVEVDAETIKKARQSGAFSVPVGGKASFLLKQINENFVENHKKNIRENIYRFSKSVDMLSDTFTGSGASGEARKWIMTPLEFRVAIKQMKFAKGLYMMFRILETAWRKKNIGLSSDNIKYVFDRNFPQELKLEAEILQLLDGRISKRTQLEIFSPVRDVDAELKRIEDEKAESVDLDEPPAENEDEEPTQ